MYTIGDQFEYSSPGKNSVTVELVKIQPDQGKVEVRNGDVSWKMSLEHFRDLCTPEAHFRTANPEEVNQILTGLFGPKGGVEAPVQQ